MFSEEAIQDVIDAVYEAAFEPELWPTALDQLARIGRGIGTTLFTSDTRTISRWTCSESLRPLMQRYIDENWAAQSERPRRMVAAQPFGFITESDVYTPEELHQDKAYIGFFRPHGLGWGAGTFVPIATGDVAVFSVERLHEDGPFGRSDIDTLNLVRPFLARSALLAIRLEFKKAKAAVDALGRVSLPAIVLRADGSVLAANGEAERDEIFHLGGGGRWLVRDKVASRQVQRAIADLGRGGNGASVPLRKSDGRAAAVLHVLPVRGSAEDVFARSSALVVATPLEANGSVAPDMLRSLFDLSPAEARLTKGLSDGLTLEEISISAGVKIETTRTQLKKVFEKTGTKRQAELVRLLTSVSARMPK